MRSKECVAMILAGGRGERLGALTYFHSKPAIYFGGNHRIIDFTLSNCRNSRIDTIGILSQCFTTDLNEYINSMYVGKPERAGIHMLTSKSSESLYKGTADAVYQNLAFIEQFSPQYVLVLASDHVYKMDYQKLIAFHKEKGADATVASIPVPMEEASRFGILNTEKDGRVYEFEEKPGNPKSNLASMGIYVFNWSTLKKYLLQDSGSESQHDFGKNILPSMLFDSKLYTYQFNGYWRDVGTLDKLWEANMDQLDDLSILRSMGNMRNNPLVNENNGKAVISQSIIPGGCSISGTVKHSVLGDSVTVGRGSEIVNSVIMPNVFIGNNVKIYNTIIGTCAAIMDHTVIGSTHGLDYFVDHKVCAGNVSLVAPWLHISKGMHIQKNSQVYREKLEKYFLSTRKTKRDNDNYVAAKHSVMSV